MENAHGSSRTVEAIQEEIDQMKKQLETVKGRVTEVYSRVTGYYAPVSHYNRGKKAEYRRRKVFDISGNFEYINDRGVREHHIV